MATELETILLEDPEQIIEPVGYDFGLSRRGFVQVLGAGLLIAASAGSVRAQSDSKVEAVAAAEVVAAAGRP